MNSTVRRNATNAARTTQQAVTREDFARLVRLIESTESDETARCRMGVGIARKLAGLSGRCSPSSL